MKKFFLAMLVAGCASRAEMAAMYTTASFSDSKVCRKYKCMFLYKTSSEQAYKLLIDGIDIYVKIFRSTQNKISRVHVTYGPESLRYAVSKEIIFLVDFSYWLTGKKIDPRDLSTIPVYIDPRNPTSEIFLDLSINSKATNLYAFPERVGTSKNTPYRAVLGIKDAALPLPKIPPLK